MPTDKSPTPPTEPTVDTRVDVLVADDERALAELMEIVLRKSSRVRNIVLVETGDAALEELKKRTFGLVITDGDMPGEAQGLDVLRAAKKIPGTKVLFASARLVEQSFELEVRKENADGLLVKIFTLVQFGQAVQRLLY